MFIAHSLNNAVGRPLKRNIQIRHFDTIKVLINLRCPIGDSNPTP